MGTTKTRSGRTSKVILSAEAEVLKKLRLKHGLSMRAAGKKLGYSDSYISQIENGREKIPEGERLAKFLYLYGDITEKYFKQLTKQWTNEETDQDRLIKLVRKLADSKVKILLALAEKMAKGEI